MNWRIRFSNSGYLSTTNRRQFAAAYNIFFNKIQTTSKYRYLTALTNEFVGFYSIAPNGAIGEYWDSPSRSMFSAALPSRS